MWSGEEEFKPLLQKALLKASKGSLAAVTDLAVRDEKWCYKSVCFGLEKAAKRVHKKQRLNVLYIVSDICRKSKSRLASKDKYGARFQTVIPLIIQRLDAIPLHHLAQAEKVLQTWRRESLFAPDTLSEYERLLAEAKEKAEVILQTGSSAVVGAHAEESQIQAPELSPDTYDPFQASLEDGSDLPGPPPVIPGLDEVEETPQLEVEVTPQLEPPSKKLKLSPKAAAKEAAEQSGSIARAQAIADRLGALSRGSANGTLAGPPATGSGISTQPQTNGTTAGDASLSARQAQEQCASTPKLPVADTAKRLRPSKFDQPAAEARALPPPQLAQPLPGSRPSKFDQPATEAELPPPPQLAQPLPGSRPSKIDQSDAEAGLPPPPQLAQPLPGPPPPGPPPQPLPQLQSESGRESQESMRQKALAIAARFAAAADAEHRPLPVLAAMAPNGGSAQRAAAKQLGAAGASAESEFEDSSDPFKGLPPVRPAPAPPLPQAARFLPAETHLSSRTAPSPPAKQPEQQSSQPKLQTPLQAHASWASQQDPHAAQWRAPQPPRGPPPGQPQAPPPRPPPPGPRPPPGTPPTYPPPQHYLAYPPHAHARPPLGLPPGAPAWRPPPGDFLSHLHGGNQHSCGSTQGARGAPLPQAGAAVAGQSEDSGPAEDVVPPPPPPLPPQADAAAVH